MTFSHDSPSVSVREIELRREIVAVMRLRGSFHKSPRRAHPLSQILTPQTFDRTPIERAILPVRILSICDYEGLRLSREWLLNREGYLTESRESRDSFDDLPVSSFRLAIVCHSVAQDQAIRIADMLHRNSSRIRVMRLGRSEAFGASCFDCELDGFTEPGQLLEIVRETILSGPRPRLRG